MINPDGTNTIQLTNNPGADYHPQISPSGDKIVFVWNLDPQGLDCHIFIMNTDGIDKTQLTFLSVREDSPWFSPEGDRLVFRKTTPNGVSHLFILDVDVNGLVNITNDRISALYPVREKDNYIYFVSGLVNITNDRISALHPVGEQDGYIYFMTHGSNRRIWKLRPECSD